MLLTKTEFIKYIGCPIHLWLTKHRPELLPKETPSGMRILAMGREVDNLSRQLFPDGTEVEGFNEEGWNNTQKIIRGTSKVLFQPTVIADLLTCRADVLTKNSDNSWDINEVKMGASVKEDYVYDLAFQRICFENAGIQIGRTNLIHINSQYVRNGDIEPEKLFISEDITNEVETKISETKELIPRALQVSESDKTPDPELLQSCPNPKTCDFLQYYCEGIPEVYSVVAKLPTKHLLELIGREILDPKKIPASVLKSIGYKSASKFTKINAPAIREELKALKYPLYFFDYETYSAAIPPFDGTRPYQNIPFQYSLIIKEGLKSAIHHTEFLARSFENPVPALLSQLKKDIGVKGSVIAWNASFEKKRNEEMAKMEPAFSEFLKSVNDRVFDLMIIFQFKNQLYTKSEFHKSASLKTVLPVICPELSYGSLAIQEGGEASASWPTLTNDKISEAEKEQLANDMLTYCKRDTEAMVCILDQVNKEIK